MVLQSLRSRSIRYKLMESLPGDSTLTFFGVRLSSLHRSCTILTLLRGRGTVSRSWNLHTLLAAFLPHLPPMQGGSKRELPKDVRAKQCVLNIQNDDQQYLKCYLIRWDLGIYKEDQAGRWGKYLQNFLFAKKPKAWKPIYAECSLELGMLFIDRGSNFDDIAMVESDNPGLGISAHKWHTVNVEVVTYNFPVIMRLPAQPRTVTREVLLLLHDGHWCLITNFQQFASQRSFAVSRFAGTSHNASHACARCLENFGTHENLEKHIMSCYGI